MKKNSAKKDQFRGRMRFPFPLLGQCVFDEIHDDVCTPIKQDQRIADEPVFQVSSKFRQRLQDLGGTVVQRYSIGVAAINNDLCRSGGAGFSSIIDDFNCLPSGPSKTAVISRLITGCASAVKMSPGFALARFSRTPLFQRPLMLVDLLWRRFLWQCRY
jgi:hypothetical protein